MNPLTKQSVNIDIDADKGTYSVDFVGCKLEDAYKVLVAVVQSMESGDMFTEELNITDGNGNPLNREQVRNVISRAREEVDSTRASGFKTSLH